MLFNIATLLHQKLHDRRTIARTMTLIIGLITTAWLVSNVVDNWLKSASVKASLTKFLHHSMLSDWLELQHLTNGQWISWIVVILSLTVSFYLLTRYFSTNARILHPC